MSPLLLAADAMVPAIDSLSKVGTDTPMETTRSATKAFPKLGPDEASGMSYLKHLGLKALTTVSKEAEAITIRTDERRRAVNLAALDVWAVYNEEAAALEKDKATSVTGHLKAFADSAYRSDEKTLHDDHAKYWADERLLVTKLKKRIEAGEAKTIKEALGHIKKHGSAPLKKSARYYLDELDRVKKSEAKWFPDDRPLAGPHEFPIVRLIDYTSESSPSDEKAKNLLDQGFRFEAHHHAVNSPYALYSLVKEVAEDKDVRVTAKTGKKALEGDSSVGRAAYKFMMSPEGESLPADIGLMFVSAGLGSLARLKTLTALSKAVKAGHIGSKTTVGLSLAAEFGAETTALWALSTGKEALSRDVSKVFSEENLMKSYAATAMMLGALKGFGGIGRALGGSAAKSLGMATEKGVTTGGKILIGAAGHGAALTGMVASRKAGEALELSKGAVGGEKEALVHDVLGYVRFALAHKGVDALLGGKLSAATNKSRGKISEAERVFGEADTMPAEKYAPTPSEMAIFGTEENPISLGPYRKGASPSPAGTFHAARIGLEVLLRKIESGERTLADVAVHAGIAKYTTVLAKYEALQNSKAGARPKLHARAIVEKAKLSRPKAPPFAMAARAGTDPMKIETRIKPSAFEATRNIRPPLQESLKKSSADE